MYMSQKTKILQHLKVVHNLIAAQIKLAHPLAVRQLVVMMEAAQKHQTQVLVQAIKQVRG